MQTCILDTYVSCINTYGSAGCMHTPQQHRASRPRPLPRPRGARRPERLRPLPRPRRPAWARGGGVVTCLSPPFAARPIPLPLYHSMLTVPSVLLMRFPSWLRRQLQKNCRNGKEPKNMKTKWYKNTWHGAGVALLLLLMCPICRLCDYDRECSHKL